MQDVSPSSVLLPSRGPAWAGACGDHRILQKCTRLLRLRLRTQIVLHLLYCCDQKHHRTKPRFKAVGEPAKSHCKRIGGAGRGVIGAIFII